jgi:ATP-dependent RNA helicase DDX49/DBP8
METSPAGSSFATLGVDHWLTKQCAMLHINAPTEVQQSCIPNVMSGKHVVAGAATGSGKTAAFALPILQLLAAEMYGVFALVVTPSRELAYQILDQFIAFGAPLGIKVGLVIGGVAHGKQLEVLQTRPHVVVGTPGRLRMLYETYPEAVNATKNLRFLVLDEADRLTEGPMRDDVLAFIEAMGAPKPFRRTLLFTATVNRELTRVADGLLPQLGVVSQDALAVCSTSSQILASENEVRTVAPNLTQRYLYVPVHVKMQYLVCLLRTRERSQSAIIFTNSCVRCEVVRLTLQLLGFPVTSLNSLLTQQQRLNNLALFKAGFSKFLVATDIAARGLDIPEVAMVLHYDIPKLSATYVHRVGRTARAGRSGDSIALVTSPDVAFIHKIERRTKSRMGEFTHSKVNDDAVLGILDHVSGAKVEARLTVKREYGDRADAKKEFAYLNRAVANAAIRKDNRNHRRPPAQPAVDGEAAPQRVTHTNGDADKATAKARRELTVKSAASRAVEKPSVGKKLKKTTSATKPINSTD